MRLYNSLTDLPKNSEIIQFDSTLQQWIPSTIDVFSTIPTLDSVNDYLLVLDATDATHKKVSIASVIGTSTWTFSGTSGLDQIITAGDTLQWASKLNSNLEVVASNIDTATLGFVVSPTTGGTTQQVMIFDDNTDSFSWGAPISIAAGSSSYMSYDDATRELSVSNLLITDVTVDIVQTSIANYVATSPVHQEGDVIILTAATDGSETWIHNGGITGTTADYTQIFDGAHMTSFSIAGDSGSNSTIVDGDVVTIAGGDLLKTVGSPTDTLTIGWDAVVLSPGDIIQSDGTTMNVLNIGNGFEALQVNSAGNALEYVAISDIYGADASSVTKNGSLSKSFDIKGGEGINTSVSQVSLIPTFVVTPFPATSSIIPVSSDTINFFDTSDSSIVKNVSLSNLTWTISGDSGVDQNISLFDTMTITGSDGISTVTSATDTLTITQVAATQTIVESDYEYVSDTINIYDSSSTTMKKSTLEELKLVRQIISKNTSYIATAEDEIIHISSTTGGAVNITIPSAATVQVGRRYKIKAPLTPALFINAATVTSVTNIDTTLTYSFYSVGQTIEVVSNGSVWLLV